MNIESLPEKKQGCPAERERRRRNMGGKFNMQRGKTWRVKLPDGPVFRGPRIVRSVVGVGVGVETWPDLGMAWLPSSVSPCTCSRIYVNRLWIRISIGIDRQFDIV